MSEDKSKDRRYTAGGLFVPGGMFIGMGIGWALGHLVPGLIAGLGAGLLLFGVVMLTGRD